MATIDCPHCGARETRHMPIGAGLIVYRCAVCRAELRPLPGDCCVFCSHADRACAEGIA